MLFHLADGCPYPHPAEPKLMVYPVMTSYDAQVERIAAGLVERICRAHSRRPVPDAIGLLPICLIRFSQAQRSTLPLALTMSPRDR